MTADSTVAAPGGPVAPGNPNPAQAGSGTMLANEARSEYVAGVCNIGGAEVAARRRTAIAATVGSAVLAAGLVVGRAPRAARVLLGIPIAGTAVAWLQVRDRFCVAYAAQGVENVARPLGATAAVTDPEARRADRRRAAQMGAKGALVGVVGAIVMWLIPV